MAKRMIFEDRDGVTYPAKLFVPEAGNTFYGREPEEDNKHLTVKLNDGREASRMNVPHGEGERTWRYSDKDDEDETSKRTEQPIRRTSTNAGKRQNG